MLQKIIITFLISLLSYTVYSQEKGLTSENRLFHIERSKNRNLVCYDINLSGGVPDNKQPIEVYWVNQEEHPGRINGLSAMEKKFAYGYKVVSRTDKTYKITLTAYPGRELTIEKDTEKYICTVNINGEKAQLKNLYVKAKDSNSLSVEYVELTGISLQTGEKIIERVTNKKE